MNKNNDIPSNIEDAIKAQIKQKYPNIPDSAINSVIEEQKHALVESDCAVYCKDCGVIFFMGYKTVDLVAFNREFLDFKMLAFRHAWDTGHNVMVSLAYFKQNITGAKLLPSLVPAFNEDNEINYSKSVEQLRERLKLQGSSRAGKSFDENWNGKDECVCSVCKKTYSNPRVACYCCFGQKPWMPYDVVDTIRVGKV